MDFDKLLQYQKMLQQSLKDEQLEDRKIELLSIINQLTSGPKNLVQREQIIVEASSRGFTEDEIGLILEDLISEKIIYESSPGFIKKR
jgi:DNA replicative helicase MCM subunit Mcm2 (Cdc46/Mcm family)